MYLRNDVDENSDEVYSVFNDERFSVGNISELDSSMAALLKYGEHTKVEVTLKDIDILFNCTHSKRSCPLT